MTEQAIRNEIFALASDLPATPVAAMRALRARGKTAVLPIIAALEADELGGIAVGRLLEVLADLDPHAAVGQATRRLDDPRSNVVRDALRTLAAIGTPVALESLRATADGENVDAAAYARILLE
ncbi:MAG TPA: hypothetical protein VJ850_08350 [Candidatus Limnocylindrales bacterium]|nr:hypothetical protein [Candidatus Limnocylindrales bacterium]